MNTEQTAAANWARTATERVMDLVTMPIAYLYWKICDADDRATLESIQVSAIGSTKGPH